MIQSNLATKLTLGHLGQSYKGFKLICIMHLNNAKKITQISLLGILIITINGFYHNQA